jgi:cold shock CspA family protein
MQQGTVVRYNRQQGWGFIRPDDTDLPELFVCYKFIEGPTKFTCFVKPGQRVEFEAVDVDTQPQAHHVRVVAPITIAIQTSEVKRP